MKNEDPAGVQRGGAERGARVRRAIALATKADRQRDDEGRRTSPVALVFLPPTFVSAVFSTAFSQFRRRCALVGGLGQVLVQLGRRRARHDGVRRGLVRVLFPRRRRRAEPPGEVHSAAERRAGLPESSLWEYLEWCRVLLSSYGWGRL